MCEYKFDIIIDDSNVKIPDREQKEKILTPYNIRTEEERKQYTRQYYILYRLKNSERVKNNKKKYYEKNKEKIKEHRRRMYQKNKEEIKQQRRDKRKLKVYCKACNKIITYVYKTKHNKVNAHIQNMKKYKKKDPYEEIHPRITELFNRKKP